MHMMNVDSMTKVGRDSTEAAMKAFGVVSSLAQTVAAEHADFLKRSFEEGQKVTEKLLGVKTIQDAMQIQTEYMRSSFEGLVAQTSKMSQLAINSAKEAGAPFEGLVKKAA